MTLLAMVMFLGGLSSSLERATWGDGVRPTLGMELISFRNQCLTEDRSEIFGAGIASVWALLALGQIARASRMAGPGWTCYRCLLDYTFTFDRVRDSTGLSTTIAF